MFLFYVRLIHSIRDEEAFGWKGHCEDRMREWQEITGPFWRDVGVATLMTERLRLGVWSCMDLSLDKHVVVFFFQVTELECQSNQTPVIKSQKTELNQTIEELENTLRDKEEVCALVFSLWLPSLY